MTEQEKRYVAEKMLGWAEGVDFFDKHGELNKVDWIDHGESGENERLIGRPVDFTQPDWLGPLWKALCEKARKIKHQARLYDVDVAKTDGCKESVVWVVDVYTGAYDIDKIEARDSNPNLAVIAAYRALEGVKA